MRSVEEDKKENPIGEEFLKDRINTPIVKYFWQASPLSRSRQSSLHKYLRKINCFDHFSDYELYSLSKYLHMRNYAPQEIIFKEGDGGFGFYLIFDGNVDIFTNNVNNQIGSENSMSHVTQLSKYDYFGELALLEMQNKRNATAISAKKSTLFTIYKPDLEELIEREPVVGAKLLQALSIIVSKRLNVIAEEFKILRDKLKKMEENVESETVQG